MLNSKLLPICLALVCLNCFVWSDDYKNSDFSSLPKEPEPIHEELMKNNFDHVQIVQENIPRITKNLLWQLDAVKKLQIEFCQVRTIEKGAFNRLPFMKKLSLKHNLLEEIKNGIFLNLEIEELDLSDNQIKVIEENAFDYMNKLRSIKLKDNRLEVYNNNWFVHVPSVCNINFENNFIKTLPSGIVGNPSYRDCSMDIIFSHNLIENIDENAFNGGFRFNRLYLDHNAISNLSLNTFSHNHGIKYLRLEHNKIVCITPRLMQNVENYHVNYNPWNPDCLKAFNEGRDYFSIDTTTTPTVTTTTKLPTKRQPWQPSRFIRFG